MRSQINFYRLVGSILAEAKGFSKRQLHYMKSHNQNERGRYEAGEARQDYREIGDTLAVKAEYDERMDPTNFRPKADRPGVARERANTRRVAREAIANSKELGELEKEFTQARDSDANNSRPHPLRSVPRRTSKKR